MITKNKIILIGAPGSGKGTISSQLINNFNLQHISTGDLFREAALQNTVISSKIKELMISGELIPDEITNKLASDAILKSFDNTNGFILDGYPRTIPQAEFLTKVCSIDKVFYLKINTDSLMKRIIGCKKGIYFPLVWNLEIIDELRLTATTIYHVLMVMFVRVATPLSYKHGSIDLSITHLINII